MYSPQCFVIFARFFFFFYHARLTFMWLFKEIQIAGYQLDFIIIALKDLHNYARGIFRMVQSFLNTI
jgi:hypothetical protein